MLCLFSFQLFDIVLISGTRNVLCRRVQAISKKKDLPELLKGLTTAPLKHSQTEFISSFFGQSHNNTTIFQVMEARKHLSPFY